MNFDAMELSIASETAGMPDNVGVSVALWRLKELVKGYRYAITQGYQVPLQEGNQDSPSLPQGQGH